MGDVTTIGLDIAKASFQAHGADASGGCCQTKVDMSPVRRTSPKPIFALVHD